MRKAVEFAEDNTNLGWEDLQAHKVNYNDVVVGIAASGTTPYVIGALKKCQEKNIITACIVCNSKSPLSKVSDFPIEIVVGPEFVTGSTRMKSGTAQKLALNMISTSVMIQLGKVKGNKMVDMQLSNNKLVDRGINMIMKELEVDYNTANKLLEKYGSVRNAVNRYNIKSNNANLDSLDTEDPDGVAESLVTDLRYDPESNKKDREYTQPIIKADMKNMFPRMKIDYIEGFMKGKNGVVQGKVTEYGRIMVSKMSQPGTEYHEAWHQVSLYMLPENEAKELFDEVRSQSGEVIIFKGVQKKFSELTDKEADEWLADEFRNVVLSNGAYQVGSNKVKNWLEEMLAFIVNFVSFGLLNYDTFSSSNGIFGEQGGSTDYTYKTYNIAKFFDKVREGQFRHSKQHPDAIGGGAHNE